MKFSSELVGVVPKCFRCCSTTCSRHCFWASSFELHASLSFFEISRLDSSFLKKAVNTWSSDLSYIEGQRFARNLVCINDVAERGIQLIQQFNRSSKDEAQKQCLLQVVEQHRKHFGTTPTSSELNFI